MINYERPSTSSDVKIQVMGSRNIELVDEFLSLKDLSGSVTARFKLKEAGFDFITLAISGENDGESVLEYSKIYVRAIPPGVVVSDLNQTLN